MALLIIDEVGFEPMNRQEASLFFRLRVVPCSPVPPNKPMQRTGLRPAADRQRRWAARGRKPKSDKEEPETG